MTVRLSQHGFSKLEKELDYVFKNCSLLIEALTHPSLKHNNRSSLNYERMELLGDSILNFVVTEILFNSFQDENEGTLAKIRAYLISSEVLCKVAKRLGIAQYIIMSKGEENSDGRNNCNNLENAMEAIIAAIYLDSDIKETARIIRMLWQEHLINSYDFIANDPKTALQEWSQSHKYGIPEYEIIDKAGSSHNPLFTIKVSVDSHEEIAQGKSIKTAQKQAAGKVLKKLKNLE